MAITHHIDSLLTLTITPHTDSPLTLTHSSHSPSPPTVTGQTSPVLALVTKPVRTLLAGEELEAHQREIDRVKRLKEENAQRKRREEEKKRRGKESDDSPGHAVQ